MNAHYVIIDGGTAVPVVESAQLQDDIQAMSASVFIDRNRRGVLWKSLDYQTRSLYKGHMLLLESVFAYQGSDAATLAGDIVCKTYANGADILAVVLAPGQTSVSVTDEDGSPLENLEGLVFEDHKDCCRYVVIAEANAYNFNVPVAIHEKSRQPHMRLHDDVLTVRSFSKATAGGMMDGARDARSGVSMCSSLSPSAISNW